MNVADPDYIQWYLNPEEMSNAQAAILNYKDQHNENMAQISLSTYDKLLRSRFEEDEMQQFLAASAALTKNPAFLNTLKTSMAQLKMPTYTNFSVHQKDREKQVRLLTVDMDKFQEVVGQIKTALQQILSILGTANLDNVTDPETQQAVRILFDGDVNTANKIISLNEHQKLDATFAGQYKRLLSLLPQFAQLLQAAQSGAAGVNSDNSIVLLSKILAPIQTISGILYEIVIEENANDILEQLVKENKATNLKITRVGSEKSATSKKAFRIGTADLAVNFSGTNGDITFNVPNLGVSLKRSHKNLNTSKNITIKLKGSTIGALVRDLNPTFVTTFYTLYANTQPVVAGKKQPKLPGNLLTEAYAVAKAKMLVPALIGNIDAQYLVGILVINNQAYTIYEVLSSLLKQNNDKYFTLKPAFSTMHKDVQSAHNAAYVVGNLDGKFARSSTIRKKIDQLSVSAFLDLNIDALTNTHLTS